MTKADLLSGEGLSLAPGCHLISLSSCAEGAGSFLGSPFCKGTDPLHEGCTFVARSRPEGPASQYIALSSGELGPTI